MSEVEMNTTEFKEAMEKKTYIIANSEMHLYMHETAQRARKITAEMNNEYKTPDQIRELFSALIGQEVDKTFWDCSRLSMPTTD